MPLLEASGISKVFGKLTALDGAALTVGENEFHGLIGPNGSGKSTLMKCVAGAELPTTGKLSFTNIDITAFTPTETLHHWFHRTIDHASWSYEDGGEGDGRPISRTAGRSPILVFEITADSFLRHMNRALVGTMLDVGLGMRSVDEFVALLDGAPREQASLLEARAMRHPHDGRAALALAALLHRSGRASEALDWSQRAHVLLPDATQPLEIEATAHVK